MEGRLPDQAARPHGRGCLMCEHRFLDDPNGLRCNRTDPHGLGHTYQASDAPDRHTSEPNDD